MTKFFDRKEAGKMLAEKIAETFPEIKNGIVLGLPRGGVVVAGEVAKNLKLPLDIIVTRKIGAPGNPEYAIAATSEHQIVFSANSIDRAYVQSQAKIEKEEIQRRLKLYRGKKSTLDLKNKFVFIVDDGLATGLTMLAAIEEIKLQKPAEIVVGLPVAPPDSIDRIKKTASRIIVLQIEPDFFAVGQFYQSFDQVSDSEVKNYLETT